MQRRNVGLAEPERLGHDLAGVPDRPQRGHRDMGHANIRRLEAEQHPRTDGHDHPVIHPGAPKIRDFGHTIQNRHRRRHDKNLPRSNKIRRGRHTPNRRSRQLQAHALPEV